MSRFVHSHASGSPPPTRSLPGRLVRGLRHLSRIVLLWGLPAVALAATLVVGLVFWGVATPAGTRWALHQAVALAGGQIHGIQGSILRGLSIDELSVAQPDWAVQVAGLRLRAAWPELLQRRLHVRELSANRIQVDLTTVAGPPPESAPFSFPALPVSLQVDHLALGQLEVRQDGRPLPVSLGPLQTAVTLDADTATVALTQLHFAQTDLLVDLTGQAQLHALAAPWPFSVTLQGSVYSDQDASVLCAPLRQLAASLGKRPGCRVGLDARLSGSQDAVQVQANLKGEGLTLRVGTELLPQQPFPLGQTHLVLARQTNAADKPFIELTATPQAPDADGLRTVDAQLAVDALPLGAWLPAAVGASRLTFRSALQVRLGAQQQLQDLALRLDVADASRWNGQPLSGHVRLARLMRQTGPLLAPDAPDGLDLASLVAQGLDLDVRAGVDRMTAKGDLSAADLRLDLQARLPALAALWPGLPGGAELSVKNEGGLARIQTRLQARYEPADSREGVLGHAPAQVDLTLGGGWTPTQGWRGQVDTFQASHAGLLLRALRAVPLRLDPQGRWQVGATVLDVALQGQPLFQVQHTLSEGGQGQWATRGAIDPLVFTPKRIEDVQQWLSAGGADDAHGRVRVPLARAARDSRLDARLDWNLRFDGALAGEVHLARVGGDLTIPGETPIPLGLQQAELRIDVRKVRAGLSQVAADLQVATARMGRMQARVTTPLHASTAGAIGLSSKDPIELALQADSEDLAWLNLWIDGGLEVGGKLHADIRGTGRTDGQWRLSGPLRIDALQVLALDQGVRLLDGTLAAHFDGSHLVLDRLRFPAVRRVTPKEWRTATWVAENPDAQNGDLQITGAWDIIGQNGDVQIALHRYPIVQRADRYAMVSGAIAIRATLPTVRVSGQITADAGWFDLDMLNNIPALDSDVIVLKPGEQAPPPPATQLDLSADLTIDLGPRFYLTGYGVNSGLVGKLELTLRDGKLTGIGALRTRGGSIDAYGQHLQLRRGTVTFQGDVTNPVLDIEALRTDVAVQAGVKVAGTARRPRIDLVSHPDVSQTEKLTWLLLGHGPNEAGGDMSLLFSVGSSFLSGGEPFYRRFGLDELSMRSGALGSSGSILPAQSVVSGLDTGASPIEQRFVLAGKTLSDRLKASLEQALAQTGTVARLSYQVMRRLQAEITVGTVNGLALVYRWFSMD